MDGRVSIVFLIFFYVICFIHYGNVKIKETLSRVTAKGAKSIRDAKAIHDKKEVPDDHVEVSKRIEKHDEAYPWVCSTYHSQCFKKFTKVHCSFL